MVSETLLVPIITGGCGILSICIERTTNIVCPELRKKIINLCSKSEAQEDEEDEEDEEEPPVIPPVIHDDISNNNIIINSPATCVFDIVWESPNIGKNKSIYTSVINNGNHYNIEIPPSLNNPNCDPSPYTPRPAPSKGQRLKSALLANGTSVNK